MKKVAILGSTGSIGTQTLEIIRDNEDLQAVALAAGQNVDLMEKQIREFHPQIAGMWSEEAAADLRQRVSGQNRVRDGRTAGNRVFPGKRRCRYGGGRHDRYPSDHRSD